MKSLLLLFLTVIVLGDVQGQFSYGVAAGVNFSKESVASNDYSTSSRTAFYGGVNTAYPLARSWKLSAGLFYSGEGTRENYKPTDTRGTITRSFLRVPLLLQYAIGSDVYVETGPQLGFLLSSKEDFAGAVTDIKQYYSLVNLAWSFGAGYRLDAVLKGLGINARFAPGLTRLNKEAIAGKSLTSSVLSAGLFYTLHDSGR